METHWMMEKIGLMLLLLNENNYYKIFNNHKQMPIKKIVQKINNHSNKNINYNKLKQTAMKYIKKIIPFLLLCFAFIDTMAQAGGQAQISIINFTVKQKLPADVSTWNSVPAGIVLVAKYMGQGNIVGSKLVVQIKKGGTRICGNDQQSSVFLDAFQTRNFSANELTGYLTQCPKLSAGSYTLCVQFYGEDRKEKSSEMCRPFTVEDEVQVQQSYSPPQNITPGNGKIFKPEELKGPVTFRWTPLVPRPRDPVTYRLKVWQLWPRWRGPEPRLAASRGFR